MHEGHKQIATLLADVLPHLRRTGISDKTFKMPTGDLTQIKPDLQIKATDFVLMVRESDEFAAVLKARALVSEAAWDNYELYGFSGLQEQVLYAAALTDLKTLWMTKRPSYWGKHYRDREEEFADTDDTEETAA